MRSLESMEQRREYQRRIRTDPKVKAYRREWMRKKRASDPDYRERERDRQKAYYWRSR